MSNLSTHELRFTETNSADDSAGKTWGVEGNLFWFVAGGGFASVVILLLLFSMLRWTLLGALVPSLIPIGLALLYVFAFRQGKPSGYDTDLFELWFKGAGFGPEPLLTTMFESAPNGYFVRDLIVFDEPACQMCGGREWIKSKGRDNYSSILDWYRSL